jgi:5-aminolevulinate synthase
MTRPEDRSAGHQLFARHGIYIELINYPTVPRGTERWRIAPTPAHDVQQIRQLADAMVAVWQELDLPRGTDLQPAEQRAQTVAAGG